MTWRIRKLEKCKATLDFSSAGLGALETSQLMADDEVLMNATTLVEFESDGCIQVLVCESCGTIHCEPGGWVQPRRLGDSIVWLPCFERIAEDPTEFRPPAILASRGVPLFDGTCAAELVDLLPLFRAEVLQQVTGRDVAKLLHWEAPLGVLGPKSDEPAVQRDRVIASSGGELPIQLDTLQRLLDRAVASTGPATLVHATPGPTLYVDGPKTPAWMPLVVGADDQLRLGLNGLGIEVGNVPPAAGAD